MKKLILFITIPTFALLIQTTCFAQKVELSAGINGNLSNYTGSLASANSPYSYNSYSVYSKTLAIGYGGSAQLKFIAQDGFIIGLQTGYDLLRSKKDVAEPLVTVNTSAVPGYVGSSATPGDALSTRKFINAAPYLGYRLKKRKYAIDFLMGGEIAFNVENYSRRVIYPPYPSYQSYYDKNLATDYRLKSSVCFNYKRLGIDLSYAHGLTNLANDNSNGSAYSQLIKLGVNYRIF